MPSSQESFLLNHLIRNGWISDAVSKSILLSVDPTIAGNELERVVADALVSGEYVESEKILEAINVLQEQPTNLMGSVPRECKLQSNDEGSIREYLERIIEKAIALRGSDIHFEPLKSSFRIRCRVDGKLIEIGRIALPLKNAVSSMLKLMSDLDIAEKRFPQDGRFRHKFGDHDYDFRVSSIPSTKGESVVLRILDQEKVTLDLGSLGMNSDHQSIFERAIHSPDGLFLVTGPTGSGKSTTLYSALHRINRAGNKIITVEDPIEYVVSGINQVQICPEVSLTFATALRAILRQAPNTIMIGEIRDQETADIAINASLTGHAVFSSLHTNDSFGAITRLVDLGAKPFLLAAALRIVVAQRLVRYIPEHSRTPYELKRWQALALGDKFLDLEGHTFYRAGEYNQDFRGRIGIFEMFEVTEQLGELIYQNAPREKIRCYLDEIGFRNMRYDGVCKAREGKTTLDEVISVTTAEAM